MEPEHHMITRIIVHLDQDFDDTWSPGGIAEEIETAREAAATVLGRWFPEAEIEIRSVWGRDQVITDDDQDYGEESQEAIWMMSELSNAIAHEIDGAGQTV